jgi:AraC-like DNA-binding protein
MKNKGNDTSNKPVEQKYTVTLEPREVPVKSQDKKFLDEFLDIVEKNLEKPDFDINALCKELLESRATLNRKIKKLTGVPPMQFIQSYRLKRAKQLLEKNVGNVSEVAKLVGFSNEFNFSKSFKRKFGQSPKAYQSDYLKKNADKTREKQLAAPQNRGLKKKMSIQVEFTIDELDREYISRVVATKSEHMFDFKDPEGTPQRDEFVKQVEMLYDPPIPLSSNEALKHFTLREIVKKMRHKIEKMRKDVR